MLASMSWPQWLLSVVLIFVCLFLILVILLQRGRGGGISSAFGGGGGSGAFGAKTGDVFTWITVVVAGIFVVLAVAANFAFDQSAAPVVEAPVKPDEPQLIPVQMGEDGQALPINIEQIPPPGELGIKDVTITPTTTAPTPAAPTTAPAQPGATEGAAPAPAEKPAEKPKEEPASP